MIKSITMRVFVWFLAVLILAGCSNGGNTTSTPTEFPHPHIRGIITNLSFHDDGSMGIIVEGKIEADTQYDKALVGINQSTQIGIRSANGISEGKMTDLEIGDSVEITFIGPIATSYPVQAIAGKIVILP